MLTCDQPVAILTTEYTLVEQGSKRAAKAGMQKAICPWIIGVTSSGRSRLHASLTTVVKASWRLGNQDEFKTRVKDSPIQGPTPSRTDMCDNNSGAWTQSQQPYWDHPSYWTDLPS